MATVRVWDPLVRIGHWTLVITVFASWFTRDGFGRLHDYFGYAALAVVLVRLAWGFVGPPHARFASFVSSPRHTFTYMRDVIGAREKRHLGHNPLGGWMIIALIGTILATCFTGWLYTTDLFWGEEWLEDLHAALGTLILPLVALHVAGVIFTSWRQRENLIAAMINGVKEVRADDTASAK